ncbi:MAG TPA: hypothetical protein VEW48_25310 [Thermoanaerobaculia bacterium]|nr:hypothetical protein [Thermoanaerobaculia bacterium]
MAYETPNEKKLLDELKGADDFAVEKDLNQEDLEEVSGGSLCRCAGDASGCNVGCGGNEV